MQKTELIEPGKFYHIYNRGINSCNLFEKEEDYLHFLTLYEKYIHPIGDTFAYVLMKNHFHLLVRLKENIIYKYSNANKSKDAVGFERNKWETIPNPNPNPNPNLSECEAPDSVKENIHKIPSPTKHFSHLFNAYSKYLNKRYMRHGALFERPFKRKEITSDEHLKNTLVYIHQNPVHHHFCHHALEYSWSSYLDYLTEKSTIINRDQCMEWFNDKEHFINCHDQQIDVKSIDSSIGL